MDEKKLKSRLDLYFATSMLFALCGVVIALWSHVRIAELEGEYESLAQSYTKQNTELFSWKINGAKFRSIEVRNIDLVDEEGNIVMRADSFNKEYGGAGIAFYNTDGFPRAGMGYNYDDEGWIDRMNSKGERVVID